MSRSLPPLLSRLRDADGLPDGIPGLSLEEKQTLAQELRDEIIGVVAHNGGHLAPSLGVVELTLARARVSSTTPREGARCPPLCATTPMISSRSSWARVCFSSRESPGMPSGRPSASRRRERRGGRLRDMAFP